MGLNVMTGNRALLKIKGQTIGVGLVQNVSTSDDLGLQAVSGLGKAEAVELVTGMAQYRISMSQYFIYNKKLIDLGFQPKRTEYLTSGEMDIEILDTASGETLEHYSGCKLATSGRTYGKHSPTTQEATFMALTKIV